MLREFVGPFGVFWGGNDACFLGAIRGFVRDHRGTGGFGDLLGGVRGFFGGHQGKICEGSLGDLLGALGVLLGVTGSSKCL